MIRTRQDGFAADVADGGCDLLRIRRDDDPADVGRTRTLPDMHNHRQAANVGERLAGQTLRRHPGGDDDDSIPVVDHGLKAGRGKLERPPYTYCDRLEKQLVSARFEARGDRDDTGKAVTWTVGLSTK